MVQNISSPAAAPAMMRRQARTSDSSSQRFNQFTIYVTLVCLFVLIKYSLSQHSKFERCSDSNSLRILPYMPVYVLM